MNHNAQWRLWGPVDQRDTLAVVRRLQAKGLHVRVERVENRNDIWVTGDTDG